MEYDPDNWQTWPVPAEGVNTRHPDGRPWRLNEYGEGWIDGYSEALQKIGETLRAIK